MNNKKAALSVFSLTMITIGSVDSIRNLPATALFGSQLIAFFLLGAIFFLLPTALISAELTSGWPKQGGVYIWVKEAFGKRMGFLAIWLQWIENVIWYPTILSFVGGTVGYLIDPRLADDSYFLWAVIVASFWGVTFINLRGMQMSAFFSSICAISGLLLPMGLIISVGVIWVAGGNTMHINLDWHSVVPNLHDKTMWVSLTAIMLSLCGIEIATVHARDVDDPQHAFPRALAYSVVIILSTLILGALTIAIVLPENEINLVAGIMQAFDAFFARYHLTGVMPIIAIMLVMGGLGSVNNWIIAPTKGLLVAAEDDNLPNSFSKTNNRGAPTSMLIGQAIIVTIISSLFLFMPSVNGSYWFLTALAAQLYMLMYFLLLLAGIKLRLKAPEQHRPFRIPGGFAGMLLVALTGIFGVVVTFIVSFMPPEGIDVGPAGRYELMLLTGFIFLCLPPFVSAWLHKHESK